MTDNKTEHRGDMGKVAKDREKAPEAGLSAHGGRVRSSGQSFHSPWCIRCCRREKVSSKRRTIPASTRSHSRLE
jgi:hypothetical protein